MNTTIEDIDRARLQLEKNVKELQDKLKHWRVEEAEYEGLKEEIAAFGDSASEQQIRDAAVTSQGHAWNQSDLNAILESNGLLRTPSQIMNLLERRIDYVQQNIKTTEKRLVAEQEKLDQANFLGHRDEGGLPLMEITEELDEDDNVIASSVVKPGEAAPRLLDMLEQNGVKDDTILDSDVTGKQEDSAEKSDMTPIENAPPVPARKKSVTFSDIPQVKEIESSAPDRSAKLIAGIDVSESQPIENPLIPENESAEESALRRQMLEYNMRDIGTIVAEMDMDDSESDDDEDEDNEDTDSEEGSEDEYGRTTAQVISESYRQKMRQLEKKLNARAMINIGPDLSSPRERELEDEPNIETETVRVGGNENATPIHKGVRFAPELDIQDAPSRPISQPNEVNRIKTTKQAANPLSETIVERLPSNDTSLGSTNKKVSKFKAARQDTSNEKSERYTKGDNLYPTAMLPTRTIAQTRPKSHETISESVLEREAQEMEVREPDHLEPELHAAEVRNAYHRMRNDMIQRENGFMEQDMEEFHDENGRPQISRFKAARLARQRADQEDI